MSLVATILDALVPDTCVGCGVSGAALCRPCLAQLHDDAPRRRDPSPRPAGLPPVTAAGAYAGTLRSALLSYKERGRTRLAEPLARLLAAAIVVAARADCLAGPIAIVGVPSTARARRDRGHDHVDTLAVAAVRSLRTAGIPAVRLRALRRRRSARDSAGLSAAERTQNAGSAFVVRRRARRHLLGRTVFVVDDIVTTGSTAAAVTAALQGAGARVAGIAVVAATTRRNLVKAGNEV